MQFDVQNKQEIEKLKNHSMTLQEQNRKIAKKLEKITRQEKQEQKGMRFVLGRVHAFREKRAAKSLDIPYQRFMSNHTYLPSHNRWQNSSSTASGRIKGGNQKNARL